MIYSFQKNCFTVSLALSVLLSGCPTVSQTPAIQASKAAQINQTATPTPPPIQIFASDEKELKFASADEVQRLRESVLVDKYNALGLKLFQSIFVKEGLKQNILISPLSIVLALAMAYNGSAGETRKQMAQVLDLEGFSITEFNQLSQILWRSLNVTPTENLDVQIANSIWADLNISSKLKPQFVQENLSYYQAQLASLNFRTEPQQAAEQINAWIEKKTKGLIKNVVTGSDVSKAILFLVNTLYFKGSWQTAFDERKTKQKDFFLASKQVIQIPMMLERDFTPYWQNPQTGTQFLQMVFEPTPQEKTKPSRSLKYAMTFVLPAASSELKNEVEALDLQSWQAALKEMKRKNGYYRIPKFESDFGVLLQDYFVQMGMDLPFDVWKADFSNMLTGSTPISKILHKTKIKIHEKGVEAAAVTLISFPLPSSNQPEIEFNFEANRPFLYLIHDLETGLVLFVGSLINPESQGG
jgi:serine protease inhibitor